LTRFGAAVAVLSEVIVQGGSAMSVSLNHTIVWVRDKSLSARFLAEILGVPVEPETPPFVPVRLANGVTLDYADTATTIQSQHYAFALTEEEFEAAFTRITSAGIPYYADPFHRELGVINHMNGGRGVYFNDPDGHNMEILTRP